MIMPPEFGLRFSDYGPDDKRGSRATQLKANDIFERVFSIYLAFPIEQFVV